MQQRSGNKDSSLVAAFTRSSKQGQHQESPQGAKSATVKPSKQPTQLTLNVPFSSMRQCASRRETKLTFFSQPMDMSWVKTMSLIPERQRNCARHVIALRALGGGGSVIWDNQLQHVGGGARSTDGGRGTGSLIVSRACCAFVRLGN